MSAPVCIETLAGVRPEECLSSVELERRLAPLYERIGLSEGRLELMTGIRERRLWPEGANPSDASAMAGRAALERSAVPAGEIDLLIHCAVSRDRLEPATAAYVHRQLGLGAHVQILDISNACLGFLNALLLGSAWLQSGQARSVLVVAGENGRPLIENTLARLNDGTLDRKAIKPYFANLTVGCAAVAAVLCREDDPRAAEAMRLTKAVIATDTEANELCEGGSGEDGLGMQTDSEALLEAGVALAQKNWLRFKEATGWDEQTPDRIICHQVGRQHQRRLFDGLGLDLARDHSTFETLGNVGAVALPITLADALEQGVISRGQKVALLGIGSGLSSIMAALEV